MKEKIGNARRFWCVFCVFLGNFWITAFALNAESQSPRCQDVILPFVTAYHSKCATENEVGSVRKPGALIFQVNQNSDPSQIAAAGSGSLVCPPNSNSSQCNLINQMALISSPVEAALSDFIEFLNVDFSGYCKRGCSYNGAEIWAWLILNFKKIAAAQFPDNLARSCVSAQIKGYAVITCLNPDEIHLPEPKQAD